MDEQVCPFMSRPVVTDGWAIQEIEVMCRRERCAAWHRPRSPMLGGDPYLPGHCILLGRSG